MNETNAEAWLALGEVRAAQGEWEEAQRVYEDGAYKCPQDLRLKQLASDGDIYYNPETDKDWMNKPGFDEEEILAMDLELDRDGKSTAGLFRHAHTSSRQDTLH